MKTGYRYVVGLFSIATLVFVACNTAETETQETATTTQEQSGQWESLFDAKTTAGWHTYGKDRTGSAWKVEDSALHLDASVKDDWQTKDGGDIVTNGEYGNFHLKLEWKIAKGGNSGIMFYVHEDTAKYQYPWETGPEMQVVDNEGHPDGKIAKSRAGDLYDLIEVSKPTVKKAGEWNQVEIIANRGKLDVQLNGEHVLSTTLWDDHWKALLAGSKFKTMPDFGTFQKGRIALQDHGADVWYRNIQIKRL